MLTCEIPTTDNITQWHTARGRKTDAYPRIADKFCTFAKDSGKLCLSEDVLKEYLNTPRVKSLSQISQRIEATAITDLIKYCAENISGKHTSAETYRQIEMPETAVNTSFFTDDGLCATSNPILIRDSGKGSWGLYIPCAIDSDQTPFKTAVATAEKNGTLLIADLAEKDEDSILTHLIGMEILLSTQHVKRQNADPQVTEDTFINAIRQLDLEYLTTTQLAAYYGMSAYAFNTLLKQKKILSNHRKNPTPTKKYAHLMTETNRGKYVYSKDNCIDMYHLLKDKFGILPTLETE